MPLFKLTAYLSWLMSLSILSISPAETPGEIMRKSDAHIACSKTQPVVPLLQGYPGLTRAAQGLISRIQYDFRSAFPVVPCCLPVSTEEPARPSELSRFEYTEYHMGVDVRIVAYADNRSVAERACAAAFERFAELDTIMSDYRPDSELMRLCSRAGGPPVTVSADLFRVLKRSQELAARSGGAFDITCGPLVRLWRAARKSGVAPAQKDIDNARARMGWRLLRLDARRRTAQLSRQGMQLDLGGIGKGYADDCVQRVLKKYGVSRALVEAGGDIVVTSPPPGQTGWKIQVPNAEGASAPPLLFANVAVSTSGDLEQSVLIGGQRYSHIVDPRTGRPLTDRIQVTIVAQDGLTSDGLSTAVSVLGPEKGRALAATYPGTRVYLRYATGDDPETHRPGRFDKR